MTSQWQVSLLYCVELCWSLALNSFSAKQSVLRVLPKFSCGLILAVVCVVTAISDCTKIYYMCVSLKISRPATPLEWPHKLLWWMPPFFALSHLINWNNHQLLIGWDRYRYRVSGIGRYCRYRFRIGIGNNFPDTSTDTDRPRTARTSYGCIMKNNGPSLMRNIKQIKSTTSCL